MNRTEWIQLHEDAERLSLKILKFLEKENQTNKVNLKAIRIAEQKIYEKKS